MQSGRRRTLGASELEVLHTPGHSKGSSRDLFGEALLRGDTIFVGNVGRVEVARGPLDDMHASLSRIRSLSPETRVFAGHDSGDHPSSTLGLEARMNAYFRDIPLGPWRILMGLLGS